MEIRKLKPKDSRRAVSCIYEESWKAAYKDIIPADYLESIPKGHWAANIDRSGTGTLLVLEEGQIIGTSSYCKARRAEMEGFGEIVSLYLLPEYIGRGFGRSLMEAAVEELKALGFSDIYLWVLEENGRARRFYEKFGFQFSGIVIEDEIGGRKVREVQYRYHVDASACENERSDSGRKADCPCKRSGCVRHGDCAACQEHHHKSEKMPLTTCERLGKK